MGDDGQVTPDPETPLSAAPPTTPERSTAGSGRASHSLRDIAISLAVLVVPIVAIVLVARSCDTPTAPTIDASAQYRIAGESFAVVTPHPLPSGWRTVTALVEPTSDRKILRVGLTSPGGGAAQIVEASGLDVKLVPDELGKGKPTPLANPELIAGATWQLYEGRGGQHALVSVRPATIVVINGTASDDELRSLAASLG
jgi:hypothetical protein